MASIKKKNTSWQRFKSNRLGYYSLWIFMIIFGISLCAELVANDRPLVASYDGQIYFPIIKDYPETVFGGDFETPTDFHDPLIRDNLRQKGNWAIYPLIEYSYLSLNYFSKQPNPAAPSADNWIGTDDRGRDVLARLIYGFRISVLFGLALTLVGVIIGVLLGGLMGYLGGNFDLISQRVIDIWRSLPELYLLIILASVFSPSIWLLVILLSLFSWINLSDYVRVEFFRNRGLEYVKAARALGLTNWKIMVKHILPNSLIPVITFLPFQMSAAILSLTSLDFLGLGVPPDTPSLGELLSQGKSNLDAWWISLSTFIVLVGTLLLLTFMGEALRNAFDPRKRGSM
ncbi:MULTISPECIES: ABC transporter permease [unclassified Polynucleobacter]|jgi:microcin C transport system permease protein|uniref:ABC transporter permease n=1 Tax=unclassified Polynucleobacter TaxID=2640945 RepID=UPI00248FAF80|nr:MULTISPECIES: ABC transporter permease [unclassified Polynucleobacter]